MKKKITVFLVIVFTVLITGCSANNDISFRITFVDVGQGDSALIECDGQFMLIDGGDVGHENSVIEVLRQYNVKELEILALSHLHSDHIGGLANELKDINRIGITISNSKTTNTKIFEEVETEIFKLNSSIKIPPRGTKYKLGSAEVEVVYSDDDNYNDSLVLLVTYKNKRILFTGDIEKETQQRIVDFYRNDKDEPFKIDLMKIPHHGSCVNDINNEDGENTLYRFIRTFMPDYAVISVGENDYGHPSNKTLNLLDNKAYKSKLYRTDNNGNVTCTISAKGKIECKGEYQ